MMAGPLVSLLLAAAAFTLMVGSGRVRSRIPPPARPGGRRGIGDAPLILDLLAAVLSSGASVEKALFLVAETCEPRIRTSLVRVHAARVLGASWDAAWDAAWDSAGGSAGGPAWHHGLNGGSSSAAPKQRAHGPGRRRGALIQDGVVEDVRQGLRFATSTGAPSAALLHAHAAQLRRRHNREVDRKAAALGVQLVLPLGLCSLPAFICLGVVPVVLGLLPL
ncbi:hypothetical protein [Arthrobacter burdickii]|uniref:Type II secretion system protein GspF domain-containing protein n=1 Tax=Arthrobacter burdickii TaxID=3035920 RepID=A0ABT8K079_9MICC|nr:hypothetical protein [Arthrobacter burdickii]MDN4610507.1 hypothetical protein [Arthrobacter burdickii]